MPSIPAAPAAATRSSKPPKRGRLKWDQTRSPNRRSRGRFTTSGSEVLDAVMGDLRSTDPPAELRVGLEHLAIEVDAAAAERADAPVLGGHPHVAVAVLLVERPGE